jgi:hypothetical protein
LSIDYTDQHGRVWRVQAMEGSPERWVVHWYQADNPTNRVTSEGVTLMAAIDNLWLLTPTPEDTNARTR